MRPSLEALEGRVVLNAAGSAALTVAAAPARLHEARLRAPALGMIQGKVTNDANSRGVGGVRIQLIDASGRVVQATRTNARGDFRFRVDAEGPYVVRQVLPPRLVQTSPTFGDVAPGGAYRPGFGSNSWNYVTGNSDPTLGPVGPAWWGTIATTGDEPFQSPIDLTGPTVDLSQYVQVHYADAVPTQIINNGHQIQVQFAAANSVDTITVGGVTSTLAQFHLHDPSEHQVGGRTASMEIHFVNVGPSGGVTAVGAFLQLGAHNDALDPVLDAMTSALTQPNSATRTSTAIHLAGLLPSDTQGWFYEGSLTTPPLASPVEFFLYATPITLDIGQLRTYERVAAASGFLPNARPIQPTNGRILNEVNHDVFFAGGTLSGVDFTVRRRSA